MKILTHIYTKHHIDLNRLEIIYTRFAACAFFFEQIAYVLDEKKTCYVLRK